VSDDLILKMKEAAQAAASAGATIRLDSSGFMVEKKRVDSRGVYHNSYGVDWAQFSWANGNPLKDAVHIVAARSNA
jgi:hypothetical protein